ncbi:GTP-binding protein [Immundisolibacter sp.]|uniref:CobW family GTP-binding protein n=1 Tax=Immundisolibacter sp. TaxID=1934948 RepID=UPI00261363CC|nr:CobW family GTP-binding protein [Immundisolibacter sp.]MDD3649929.1 GTP-binding protein [Immundisolibacter sp.]
MAGSGLAPDGATSQRLPVTLLVGFLGAGKTTVLNHLLGQSSGIAVLINEFGARPVDQALLRGRAGELAVLGGGCVCCDIKDSLAPVLRNLWLGPAGGAPRQLRAVVIEASGVADPAPLLETLTASRWLAARYRVAGVACVVDGSRTDLAGNSLFERQVALADRLLISRADCLSTAGLQAVEARLRRLNPTAPCMPAAAGAVAADWLLGPAARASWCFVEPESAAPAHHSHAVMPGRPLQRRLLAAGWRALCAELPGPPLRLKGIVALHGEAGPFALHGVPAGLDAPVSLLTWPADGTGARLVLIDPAPAARLEHALRAFVAIATGDRA